ncbi:MAG TPA: chorismate mutase, partial [Clostridia bacterium]|nr:chorismate mutase [Clostridia bacterium]
MELDALREKIDAVDETMLALFIERMELSGQVAAYKREHALPLLNKTREREILARVTQNAGELEPYVHQFFTNLFELSKARQGELNAGASRIRALIEQALAAPEVVFPHTGVIACQGIEGSNSQAAADKLFPRGNIVYVKSFEAAFNAVESGLCQFAVLPIENSTNGSVRAVYNLLQKKRFSIVRGTSLCIRH